MKTIKTYAATKCAALTLASALTTLADSTANSSIGTTSRPDSHAPIGVMGDHIHSAGEWMVSYRFMHMSMNGHQDGTNSLKTREVYTKNSPSGSNYTAAAEEMNMNMHMIGLMYAPTDKITLTGMVNYVEKNMDIVTNPHGGGHGHTGDHSHDSSGLGDVTIGALYSLIHTPQHKLHLNLGLTLPTAKVDHKEADTFLPYGMQSGTGIFGINLGATYNAHFQKFSWGAQFMKSFALEDENDSGFRYGDTFQLTTWLAAPVTNALSLSARVNYRYQEDISGHYNGPHGHAAPQHFQSNYGGHILELGVGANYVIQSGALRGHRLAVEVLTPLIQDANGVGLDLDYTVVAGWQWAF